MAIRKKKTKLKAKNKIKAKAKVKKSESTGRLPDMADLLKQVTKLKQGQRDARKKKIAVGYKEMVQQNAQQQETLARIQFEGAEHFNKALIPFVREERQPEVIPGWHLRREGWERTLKWAKTHKDVLRTLPEEFFLGHRLTELIQWPAPIIAICPSKIAVGLRFTLIGYGFGYTPGRVEIHLNCLNQTLEMTMDTWRPGAITGVLDSHNLAIPLVCQGTIRVVRGSDHTASEPVDITIRPIVFGYFMETREVTESGVSLTGYSKYIDFYSSVLPGNYQLMEFDEALGIDRPGCDLRFYAPQTLGNSPATASIYSGPTGVVNPEDHTRKLKVVVEIHDDFYYDYSVSVVFYIGVPEHFTIPAGWTALSDV